MGDKDGYGRPALDEDKVFDDLNTFRWINLVFHGVRYAHVGLPQKN